MTQHEKDEKLRRLVEILEEMGSALLAYSGGLDSTFLLKALRLSGIRALAVTGVSGTTPPRDLEDARRMAAEIGIEHCLVRSRETEDENFMKNPPDRCYYCKDGLFGLLCGMARQRGLAVVLDGSNLDDLNDHRPGIKAARQRGVRSPLVEAGYTKSEIREASKSLGLCTWDKPSSPCLSSRFPYGEEITPEALARVARAEEFLRSLGFGELRVRDHRGLARIEVPEGELRRLFEMRDRVVEGLRALGYAFVSLDLEGFRSGGMNRLIQ